MFPAGSSYLLSVQTSVPVEVAAEFDEWYTREHLPAIVALPGFTGGARYHRLPSHPVFPCAGRPYLAQYAFESHDALTTERFRAVRGFDRFTGHVDSCPAVYRLAAIDRGAAGS
ncbi:DUF4286 family protein [Rhizomonospora bruguierae]|uniref:DUF4286 family protein n=1 Tax=Rhizomonospora bruguierae TaxID=1581705 RepID=UPI001BCCFE7C|nr:DUF4286 family protein [Micromonospora sp. NBRC 107566]